MAITWLHRVLGLEKLREWYATWFAGEGNVQACRTNACGGAGRQHRSICKNTPCASLIEDDDDCVSVKTLLHTNRFRSFLLKNCF